MGQPPGCVTMDMVRNAKGLGYLIGSCSDRTITAQERMWREHHIQVDFTVLKHQLGQVKELFPGQEYYHIGDSDMDSYYSEKAGFHFMLPDNDALRLLDGQPNI